MGVKYMVEWPTIPLQIRLNLLKNSYTNDVTEVLNIINAQLQPYNAKYTSDNMVTFQKESDYIWFLLSFM